MDTNSFVNFITSLPPDTIWYLLGSVGLSAVLQKVKNFIGIENPKLLVALTSAFSFAGAAVPSLLGWLSTNPSALGSHTAVIFTGMTLGYRYLIKPSSDFLADVKAYRAGKSSAKVSEPVATAVDAVPVATPLQPATEFEG